MKLKQSFKTDQSAEVGGVWREIEGGGKLKIARFNNPAAAAEYRRLEEIYGEQMRSKDPEISEETNKKVMKIVLSKHILKGWEGMENDDGSPFEFSEEAANEMLDMPDFMRLVNDLSNERERYLEARLKEIEGK